MNYIVTLPYACFTIEVWEDRIKHMPPIVKWAYGKRLIDFEKWVTKKGGSIKLMEDK